MGMISNAAGVFVVIGLTAPGVWAGSGLLFPGAQYATGTTPRSVAVGDLDGD